MSLSMLFRATFTVSKNFRSVKINLEPFPTELEMYYWDVKAQKLLKCLNPNR